MEIDFQQPLMQRGYVKTPLTVVVLSAGVLFSTGHGSAAEIPYDTAQPDAHRLQTGQFDYRDTSDGKPLGMSRIVIEKAGGGKEYDFSAETLGYGDQQWESIATPSFVPISARLSYGKAGHRSPSFDLRYTAGKVSGFAVNHARSENAMSHSVDAPISLDTVDQRIDWATVLASDLKPGVHFRFSVYDPAIGVSPVFAQVGPIEEVRVPAGVFRAFRIGYRVEKATGTERYIVFASEQRPRVMVREDFPDGTVSELLMAQPHPIPKEEK
jgi:hypothetical protein